MNENFWKFHQIFNFGSEEIIGNPLRHPLAADAIWGIMPETLTESWNLDLVGQGAPRWLEMDVKRCQRLRKHSRTSADPSRQSC